MISLMDKTNCPPIGAGSLEVFSVAEELVARLPTNARTLVCLALRQKFRDPTVIAGTLRKRFSEYPNQQQHLP